MVVWDLFVRKAELDLSFSCFLASSFSCFLALLSLDSNYRWYLFGDRINTIELTSKEYYKKPPLNHLRFGRASNLPRSSRQRSVSSTATPFVFPSVLILSFEINLLI
jgi:hypothetical protein